jgi:hypothetical protein
MSAMLPVAPVIRIGFIFYKCSPKDCIATMLVVIFQLRNNTHIWRNIPSTNHTKNIDALAEVVGKDKAEKVFLAVRGEGDQNIQGGESFL